MAKAFDVANYLIYLAQSGDEPDYLTHLRLQKLLYYVQGWSLANRGKEMFPERIEAWAHGPVVKVLYPRFKEFEKNAFAFPDPAKIPEMELDDEEREFIGEVWEEYKPFAALKLREMTHQEPPWVNARKGFGPADRCDVEITKEAMAAYFGSLANS